MTRVFPVAGLLIAIGVAGCGSGADDTPLSQADFVKRGESICRDYGKRGKAIQQPSAPEEIGPYAKKTGALARAQAKDLRALEAKAPAAVKADYQKFLDLIDRQVGLVDQLVGARSDQKKLNDLGIKGSELNEQGNVLAARIGLKECGRA